MRLIISLVVLLIIFCSPQIQGQSLVFDQLSLLQGKKKVTIPFRYVNNFIILDVKIYGILPLHLIYDTGAEHIIIFKRQYTDLLKVPYDKRIPIMGSDLSREVYALISRNAVVEIAGLPASTADLLILEDDYFNLEELIGTSVDGLIGGDIFKNLIVRLDYKKSRLTLYDPSYFELPPGYETLPVNIKLNKPYVKAETSLQDGTLIEVELLVDTGAGVPVLLHTNSHPSLELPEHYIRGKLGMGLGGYLEGFVGRINKLTIAGIEFPGVITSFQDINPGFLDNSDRFRNGLLGNLLLSRFNVILHYNQDMIMLKPYRARQKPFQMDKSGLVIFAYGPEFNRFVIKDVIPESPAEAAGILPEDIIVRLQGIPAHYYTLEAVNAILQKKTGKRIRLVVRRNEMNILLEFHLRDLI